MSRARQTAKGPVIRSLALRLPPGHQLHTHDHQWAQFIYAARGVMSVQAGSNQWVVPPLRGLWMPSGVPHNLETISETWLRTVYIRPDLAAQVPPGIRVLEVSPLLRELILEVVRLGLLEDTNAVHRSTSTVLIAQLIHSRELGLVLPLPSDPRARAIADRVRRFLADKAPLADLVRSTGASPRTAERLFLKETGLSFGLWRQQARLQTAVRHLADGMSVTNVAFECGYESISAFVTMFKRSLGSTPGQYFNAANAADESPRAPSPSS